jgi:hypothetical protein
MTKTKKCTPKVSCKVSSNKVARLKTIQKKGTTPTDAEANESDEDQSSNEESKKDEADKEIADEEVEEDAFSEEDRSQGKQSSCGGRFKCGGGRFSTQLLAHTSTPCRTFFSQHETRSKQQQCFSMTCVSHL